MAAPLTTRYAIPCRVVSASAAWPDLAVTNGSVWVALRIASIASVVLLSDRRAQDPVYCVVHRLEVLFVPWLVLVAEAG